RGRRGGRGPAHEGAGRAGAPGAAVGAARRGACAGPLESQGRRPDAGDREVVAPGSLDDNADHATYLAPERSSDDPPATFAQNWQRTTWRLILPCWPSAQRKATAK